MNKKTDKQMGARVTYRDLRNTPGQVWERLKNDEPLTLIADGEPRAILIPVVDGDVASAQEAYIRGRAMLAASRIRRAAAQSRNGPMTLRDVNALIEATRRARQTRRRK